MNSLRVAHLLVLTCLCLPTAACDPGEIGGGESPDAWSRILAVDSFESTLVERHSYGGCSSVTTYAAIGSREGCDEGALNVGFGDPGGDVVGGYFELCGTLTIATEHDGTCHGADETTMQPPTEIASIELTAAEVDAPMTMRWRWADDVVLESEIDPAAALEEVGSSVTVRFVDSQTVSDEATREVSVDAEIVLVSEPDSQGGCGQAPGAPSGETWRCG